MKKDPRSEKKLDLSSLVTAWQPAVVTVAGVAAAEPTAIEMVLLDILPIVLGDGDGDDVESQLRQLLGTDSSPEATHAGGSADHGGGAGGSALVRKRKAEGQGRRAGVDGWTMGGSKTRRVRRVLTELPEPHTKRMRPDMRNWCEAGRAIAIQATTIQVMTI